MSPGTNSRGGLRRQIDDTWQIGNPEGNPVVTARSGSTYNGVPVTVNCVVAQNADRYSVTANAQYGTLRALTITGEITVGANGEPNTATSIDGTFNDNLGLKANMSESNCAVTFTQNSNMGIAPSRVWGVIDCPQAATASGSAVCGGNAEFLFESCGQ